MLRVLWTVLYSPRPCEGMQCDARMSARGSVEEVALTGEVHRDARGLRCCDDVLVADGTTRLHDRGDARSDEDLGTVGEREERVGGRDGPRRPLTRAADREVARVDAVDLPHAHADRGA